MGVGLVYRGSARGENKPFGEQIDLVDRELEPLFVLLASNASPCRGSVSVQPNPMSSKWPQDFLCLASLKFILQFHFLDEIRFMILRNSIFT